MSSDEDSFPDSDGSHLSDRSYSDEISSDIEEMMYSQIYHAHRPEESFTEDAVCTNFEQEGTSSSNFSKALRDGNTHRKIAQGKSRVNGLIKTLSPVKTMPKFNGQSLKTKDTDSDSDSSDSLICIDSWGSTELTLNTTNNGIDMDSSVETIDSDSSDFIEILDEVSCEPKVTNRSLFEPITVEDTSSDEEPVVKPKVTNRSLFEPITVEDTSSDEEPVVVLPKKKLKVSREQQSNAWRVDAIDQCNTRNKRYYTKDISHCKKCRQSGHNAKHCMEPKVMHCYTCGKQHRRSQCTNKICGLCFRYGHLRSRCNGQCISTVCSICTCSGHAKERCPDIWRRYHITTTGTKIVKHPKCMENGSNTYCYNCGLRGHFGHACSHPRTDSNCVPSSPYVASYKNPWESVPDNLDTNLIFDNPQMTPVMRRFPKQQSLFSNGTGNARFQSPQTTPVMPRWKKKKKGGSPGVTNNKLNQRLSFNEVNFDRTPTVPTPTPEVSKKKGWAKRQRQQWSQTKAMLKQTLKKRNLSRTEYAGY